MINVEKIDGSFLKLLNRSRLSKDGPKRLIAEPIKEAEKFGFKISPQIGESLKALNIHHQLSSVEDSVDNEVAGILKEILLDGQHISTWIHNPTKAIKDIGIDATESATSRLTELIDKLPPEFKPTLPTKGPTGPGVDPAGPDPILGPDVPVTPIIPIDPRIDPEASVSIVVTVVIAVVVAAGPKRNTIFPVIQPEIMDLL